MAGEGLELPPNDAEDRSEWEARLGLYKAKRPYRTECRHIHLTPARQAPACSGTHATRLFSDI